jgi:UDP-N-acetyl-D-glucosamine dehydrogenase
MDISAASSQLASLLSNRRARAGVIGLGYVGLPLAVTIARAGFHVLGFDIEKPKIAQLNAGESY